MNTSTPGLERLLEDNRERLRQLIRLRIDRRLLPRIDASDVVQEAFVEAATRYEKFQQDEDCSGYVWLRFLVLQKLAQLHRHHFRVKGRSILKENSPNAVEPEVSSVVLAERFVANNTAPDQAALAAESKQEVAEVIDTLVESDREILAMRHFEEMTNAEAAEALGIEPATAYKRYVRALKRFKDSLVERQESNE